MNNEIEDDEVWMPTEEGIEMILRIDEMFRTTDYDHERIAWELGLPDVLSVQILYTLGNLTGVIDAAQRLEDEHSD